MEENKKLSNDFWDNAVDTFFQGVRDYREQNPTLDNKPAPNKGSKVDHPDWYNRDGAMECIDEMLLLFGKEAVKSFCLCNWLKYRYRANAKNGAEDLKKSDWYLKKYKELRAPKDEKMDSYEGW